MVSERFLKPPYLMGGIYGSQFRNPWSSTRRLREESYKYLMGESEVGKFTNMK